MQTAKDIMVTRLVTLSPELPVVTGIERLLHANVKGAPVIDADRNYLGSFSEFCCLKVLATLCADRDWTDFGQAGAIRSGDIMARRLWVLRPEMDVYEAVNFLLAHRIAGAPVIDGDRRYLGTFSERHSMRVLIGALYDGLPSTQVSSYMNSDPARVIDDQVNLQRVTEMFLHKPFRHLTVVSKGRVVGQISRHDVLAAAQGLMHALANAGETADSSRTVGAFMDSNAKTIEESAGLFTIASIFRETAQRRLPVLRDTLLAGQITRKNLLNAANDVLNRPAAKAVKPLYLASVPGANPPGS